VAGFLRQALTRSCAESREYGVFKLIYPPFSYIRRGSRFVEMGAMVARQILIEEFTKVEALVRLIMGGSF
jgi:hypothetical protein